MPLGEIATGPAKELGLGPDFVAHRCLGFVLQDLRRPELFSEPLIVAGLRSPVVLNRNMAITALESKDLNAIPARLVEHLREASRQEPDQRVRARLVELLKKLDLAARR